MDLCVSESDIRFTRSQSIINTLQCLSHPGSTLRKRTCYWAGQEWLENLSEALLPDKDWHPVHEWGVDLDSQDSKMFEEFERKVAEQTVLIYYPLVNKHIKEVLMVDRHL